MDTMLTIKGLEEAYNAIQAHVPERYQGRALTAVKEAIELLEKARALLLTEDDIRNLDPCTTVWQEFWWISDSDNKAHTGIRRCVISPDGYDLIDADGSTPLSSFSISNEPTYKERYWMNKPTNEQRKAVSWQ